jgi:hypothetical protein
VRTSLVAAVGLVLAAALPSVAHADEIGGLAEAPARATVSVRSDSPDVTVGYVTGRAAAMSSTGASLIAIGWKDVCVAPCEFKLPEGMQELMASGPGYVGATEKFELRPGTNHFVVKPGSAWVHWGGYMLTVLGAAALITGVTFVAIGDSNVDSNGNITKTTPSWAVAMAAAGGAATAGGITMLILSSSSIQREASAPAARGLFVGYAGRF